MERFGDPARARGLEQCRWRDRGHCNDFAIMRVIGYGLLGLLLFLASFITMSRTHPIGRM